MCMPVPDPTQVINYGLSDGGRSRGGLSSEWAEDYGCSMPDDNSGTVSMESGDDVLQLV